MSTENKFTKGQICTLSYDNVIYNEILSSKSNPDGGTNYKVRQYSKYGEHGTKEIHGSFLKSEGRAE